MPEGRIPNGATVEWVSQANARALRKRGKVLAFVPAWSFRDGANNMRLPYAPEYRSLHKPGTVNPLISPDALWGDIRIGNSTSLNDRYLVEVPRDGKRPLYYAPIASVVEKQNPGLTEEQTT